MDELAGIDEQDKKPLFSAQNILQICLAIVTLLAALGIKFSVSSAASADQQQTASQVQRLKDDLTRVEGTMGEQYKAIHEQDNTIHEQQILIQRVEDHLEYLQREVDKDGGRGR